MINYVYIVINIPILQHFYIILVLNPAFGHLVRVPQRQAVRRNSCAACAAFEVVDKIGGAAMNDPMAFPRNQVDELTSQRMEHNIISSSMIRSHSSCASCRSSQRNTDVTSARLDLQITQDNTAKRRKSGELLVGQSYQQHQQPGLNFCSSTFNEVFQCLFPLSSVLAWCMKRIVVEYDHQGGLIPTQNEKHAIRTSRLLQKQVNPVSCQVQMDIHLTFVDKQELESWKPVQLLAQMHAYKSRYRCIDT